MSKKAFPFVPWTLIMNRGRIIVRTATKPIAGLEAHQNESSTSSMSGSVPAVDQKRSNSFAREQIKQIVDLVEYDLLRQPRNLLSGRCAMLRFSAFRPLSF